MLLQKKNRKKEQNEHFFLHPGVNKCLTFLLVWFSVYVLFIPSRLLGPGQISSQYFQTFRCFTFLGLSFQSFCSAPMRTGSMAVFLGPPFSYCEITSPRLLVYFSLFLPEKGCGRQFSRLCMSVVCIHSSLRLDGHTIEVGNNFYSEVCRSTFQSSCREV